MEVDNKAALVSAANEMGALLTENSTTIEIQVHSIRLEDVPDDDGWEYEKITRDNGEAFLVARKRTIGKIRLTAFINS
jgi:hypothetical protein